MFKKIDPTEISENAIKLIGKDWMLVSSGDEKSFNTMTASWGGIGMMWNHPCVWIFIRQQRHTFNFIENANTFSLSFFSDNFKDALKICGSKSGRDCDKVKLTNLTPKFFEESKIPYFEEAKLVLECKNIYSDFLKPEKFLDKEEISRWYPNSDFHKMYVAKITNAIAKI